MGQVAEIRYVFARPLKVQVGEDVVQAQPGDPVTNPEQWGRSLTAHLEAGNIVALPVNVDGAVSVEDHSDDVLLDELRRRDINPAVHASDEAILGELVMRPDLLAEVKATMGPLAEAGDEDLLTEVDRRGLSPEAVETVEGDGAERAADDQGGVGAGAPGSDPSTGDPLAENQVGQENGELAAETAAGEPETPKTDAGNK